MTMCRHCKTKTANRPRGLCYGCYDRKGVRDLYPRRTCSSNRRGVGDTGSYALPAKTTTAVPGSPEKMAVLEDRALAGVGLFHPDDTNLSDVKRRLRAWWE